MLALWKHNVPWPAVDDLLEEVKDTLEHEDYGLWDD